jgi:hypothetical protein
VQNVWISFGPALTVTTVHEQVVDKGYAVAGQISEEANKATKKATPGFLSKD